MKVDTGSEKRNEVNQHSNQMYKYYCGFNE